MTPTSSQSNHLNTTSDTISNVCVFHNLEIKSHRGAVSHTLVLRCAWSTLQVTSHAPTAWLGVTWSAPLCWAVLKSGYVGAAVEPLAGGSAMYVSLGLESRAEGVADLSQRAWDQEQINRARTHHHTFTDPRHNARGQQCARVCTAQTRPAQSSHWPVDVLPFICLRTAMVEAYI